MGVELERDLDGAVTLIGQCLCCPWPAVRYLHSARGGIRRTGRHHSSVQRCSVQVGKYTVKAETVLSSPYTCLSRPPNQHILIAFLLFFALCCNQQVLGKTECSPFQAWHHDRTKWTLNTLCISCRVSGCLSFLDK